MSGGEAEAAGWAALATLGYVVCDLLTGAAVRRLRPEEPQPQQGGQQRLTGHGAPPPDETDHQLTAGSGPDGRDGPDGPDGTNGPDEPATAPPPARQPRTERAPHGAVVAEERPWRAEERVLSLPPPVISWRSHRSASVKVMTSPEGEAALEAAEEAAPSEVTTTNEETEVTEQADATVEAAAAEEAMAATEEPSPLAEEPAPAEEAPSVLPPEVEEALVPVQAVVGCPARLEGRLSGLPKPTVAWTRDGVALHPDGDRLRQYHHDDGTFGLEIAESRETDVGSYAATAVNAAGQAATEAAFQLLDTSTAGKEWAPDFTTPLLGAKVDEGATIELDTHVTGVPLPDISWTKNGVPLEAGERVTLGYDSDKATLSIKPAVTSDAGKYEITIKNKLGEVSSFVKVKINKIYTVPQFTEKPSDVQQVPSLDAKFCCSVSGLPKPEVQWLFNDQPLKSSKKHKIRRDEERCSLSVRDCSEEDSGAYTCRATNSEGTADTSAALQVVDKLERKRKLEAPLFLKSIGDCEVFPGMQAKFTGCVAGSPEPECEWYRNDVRLYPSDRIVVENDGSGLVRLTLRTVDETDAGRYRLRIRNTEGEAACEADLTYDSFENTPTKPLKDQYRTLESQLKSGIPMPLADPPIVSRMSDRQLTLSWKPSPAAGQHIPPTYTVEMAKMPEGGFAVMHTGVRGCSVEITRLEPHCDYKLRLIVENKHGASEASPHVIAHRIGLVPPPPPENPCLPAGDTFRPDSSPLFPRGFDMDKHTGGKGHPPTNGVSREAAAGQEDDSWRYERFDPDAHTARLASQRLVLPFPAEFHPPAVVPPSSEPRPSRPREALPPSARLRPLTDDVDGYVPPSGGRPRRVAHGDEWEMKRGSNIVERLLVRRQMEEAAKSFKRAAGLETRNMARFMKPRASERISERLSDRRWDDDEDREPPRSTIASLRSTDRATKSFIPSRTAAEILGSDDDDLDAPSPSLYSRPSHHSRAASVLDEDFDAPSTYSRGAGSSRHARATSVLDDDDDDDDLEALTRRRPAAHHTRTASLLAAANDSDDDDMTPYLRRPPRLLGSRDWSSTAPRSVRATRSPVNSRDREYQDRRERHQELLNSRNRDVSAVPTATPDWQGELERHLRGRGHSGKDTRSAPVAKQPRSTDTSSVRDWESRFAADV